MLCRRWLWNLGKNLFVPSFVLCNLEKCAWCGLDGCIVISTVARVAKAVSMLGRGCAGQRRSSGIHISGRGCRVKRSHGGKLAHSFGFFLNRLRLSSVLNSFPWLSTFIYLFSPFFLTPFLLPHVHSFSPGGPRARHPFRSCSASWLLCDCW